MKDFILLKLLSQQKQRIIIPVITLEFLIMASLPIISFVLLFVESRQIPDDIDICLASFITIICELIAIKMYFRYRIIQHFDSLTLVDDKESGLNEKALAVLETMLKPSELDVDLETLAKIRVLAYKYWKDLLSTVSYYPLLYDTEKLKAYLQPLVDEIRMLIETQDLKWKVLRNCRIKQNLMVEE